jgi:retron-type reverse transcriptase
MLNAVNQFYYLNQQGLQFLNQAYVVLIPNKDNPRTVLDYRPISLIHSFAKVISKLLANRLAPELEKLVSINQITFSKKRSIHNNFMYVQHVIKDLHKRKFPSLFIKLDISNAFDTVNWSYLLHIMEQLGFAQRWRN